MPMRNDEPATHRRRSEPVRHGLLPLACVLVCLGYGQRLWADWRAHRVFRPASDKLAPADPNSPMPERDELTKAKEPFVLRDYVSSFEGATRNMNAITTIRSWQLAAVGGLVLFTKPLPWPTAAGVMLFAWIAFVLLDCNEQIFLESANHHTQGCEKRLHARTIEEWQIAVRDWTYGGEAAHKLTRNGRWGATFRIFRKEGVWPWHALVGAALVGALLLRPYIPTPLKS